jgi:hypothetical protein
VPRSRDQLASYFFPGLSFSALDILIPSQERVEESKIMSRHTQRIKGSEEVSS